MNRKSIKMETRRFFNILAKSYDEWFATKEGQYVNLCEKKAVLSLITIRPDDVILDVGTGTGIYLLEAASHSAYAVGVDYSMEMVKVAASKTLSLGAKSSIELLLGDAENLPFRERVFTKAICNTVLEFTERPNKVVFELSRVIKEDGEAVIGVLTSTSIWAIRRRLQNLWTKNVYSNAQFYTLNKFRKLLKNSGLVYAGHRWAVFTPPRCPRILIPLLKRLEKPSINHLLSGIAAFLAVKVVHQMPET